MKKGQNKRKFIVTGWVELEISVVIEAFSREGAIKKAEDEGTSLNWNEGNWGSLTVDGAKEE